MPAYHLLSLPHHLPLGPDAWYTPTKTVSKDGGDMKLLDKLLLASLILMLPLGLGLAMWLFEEEPQGESTAVDVQALEEVIKTSVSQAQPPAAPPTPEITIGTVSYASESGILTVAGRAPSPQGNILVSLTLMPQQPKPSPSPSTGGFKVEVYSIQPQPDGNFTYSYSLPKAAQTDILEIRFDQGNSARTIRFDPVTNKRIF